MGYSFPLPDAWRRPHNAGILTAIYATNSAFAKLINWTAFLFFSIFYTRQLEGVRLPMHLGCGLRQSGAVSGTGNGPGEGI